MIRTYTLPYGFGASQELQIIGRVKVISLIPNTPILFLFDEYHGSEACTLESVVNAKELIKKANVQLIGVEGYEGGFEYDDYNDTPTLHYISGMITDADCISNWPHFATRVKELGIIVFGVDSRGLCGKIEIDNYFGYWSVKANPLEQERSLHFIKTLFMEREKFKSNGSIILNAGKDHIDHIIEMIQNGEFYTLTQEVITCIRIRPQSHPDQHF